MAERAPTVGGREPGGEAMTRLMHALMDPDKRGMFLALLDDINPTTGEYAPDEIPCYVGGVDINSLTQEEREAHEAKIARRKQRA
jgi:hypothetical protein